jgi:hypothetical protein
LCGVLCSKWGKRGDYQINITDLGTNVKSIRLPFGERNGMKGMGQDSEGFPLQSRRKWIMSLELSVYE